jgi:hypothetical protein
MEEERARQESAPAEPAAAETPAAGTASKFYEISANLCSSVRNENNQHYSFIFLVQLQHQL